MSSVLIVWLHFILCVLQAPFHRTSWPGTHTVRWACLHKCHYSPATCRFILCVNSCCFFFPQQHVLSYNLVSLWQRDVIFNKLYNNSFSVFTLCYAKRFLKGWYTFLLFQFGKLSSGFKMHVHFCIVYLKKVVSVSVFWIPLHVHAFSTYNIHKLI